MASSRASTAGSATSASTSTSSPTSPRHAGSSKNGGSTTTPTDRTRASTGSPLPSLLPAPTRGITRTDSPYERGQLGGQVNPYLLFPWTGLAGTCTLSLALFVVIGRARAFMANNKLYLI